MATESERPKESPLGAAVREVSRPLTGDEVVAGIRAFNEGKHGDAPRTPMYPWYVRLWGRICHGN